MENQTTTPMPKFTPQELEVRRFERIKTRYRARIEEMTSRSLRFLPKACCIKKYVLSPKAFLIPPSRYHARLNWAKDGNGRARTTYTGRALTRLEVAVARAYYEWHSLPFPHTHETGQGLRDSIKNWRFVLRVLEIEKGIDATTPPVYREITTPIDTPYSRARQVMRDAQIRRMLPVSLT